MHRTLWSLVITSYFIHHFLFYIFVFCLVIFPVYWSANIIHYIYPTYNMYIYLLYPYFFVVALQHLSLNDLFLFVLCLNLIKVQVKAWRFWHKGCSNRKVTNTNLASHPRIRLHLSWCPSELRRGLDLQWGSLLWDPASWVCHRARASGHPLPAGAPRSRLGSHCDCSWKSLCTCGVRGQRGGAEERRGVTAQQWLASGCQHVSIYKEGDRHTWVLPWQ